MGTDTFMITPTGTRARAEKLLRENPSAADDVEPPSRGRDRRAVVEERLLEADLKKVRAFYTLIREQGCAVLAVRYRA
jgi:hypothetical protein